MTRRSPAFAWATRLTRFAGRNAREESRPLAFAPPSSETGNMESDA